jgi:hypothetical protein
MQYTKDEWNARHVLLMLRLNQLKKELNVKLSYYTNLYYDPAFKDRPALDRATINKELDSYLEEYKHVIEDIEEYEDDHFHIVKCWFDIAWYGHKFREVNRRINELKETELIKFEEE